MCSWSLKGLFFYQNSLNILCCRTSMDLLLAIDNRSRQVEVEYLFVCLFIYFYIFLKKLQQCIILIYYIKTYLSFFLLFAVVFSRANV